MLKTFMAVADQYAPVRRPCTRVFEHMGWNELITKQLAGEPKRKGGGRRVFTAQVFEAGNRGGDDRTPGGRPGRLPYTGAPLQDLLTGNGKRQVAVVPIFAA